MSCFCLLFDAWSCNSCIVHDFSFSIILNQAVCLRFHVHCLPLMPTAYDCMSFLQNHRLCSLALGQTLPWRARIADDSDGGRSSSSVNLRYLVKNESQANKSKKYQWFCWNDAGMMLRPLVRCRISLGTSQIRYHQPSGSTHSRESFLSSNPPSLGSRILCHI